MKLPTKPTPPASSPQDYTILLYGQEKIGKTTFAAQADRALFLATEPGLNALEAYQVPIMSWRDLLDACALLAQGEHDFATVVIDTVDLAYEMCMAHVCAELGVGHPADLGYGKGWSAVTGEFRRVLIKLAQLPMGLWLLSHAQIREVKTRTGTHDIVTPTLASGARRVVIGLADLVLYAEATSEPGEDGEHTERRVIRTKPTSTYDAGDRTGRLPETIDLDYQAFLAAFEAAQKGQQSP